MLGRHTYTATAASFSLLLGLAVATATAAAVEYSNGVSTGETPFVCAPTARAAREKAGEEEGKCGFGGGGGDKRKEEDTESVNGVAIFRKERVHNFLKVGNDKFLDWPFLAFTLPDLEGESPPVFKGSFLTRQRALSLLSADGPMYSLALIDDV